MKSNAIKWSQKKCTVKSLQNHSNNPRTITGQEYERLKKSIKELGYNQRILINLDHVVLSGNQRLRAIQELGIEEVEVLIPNRKLTKKEEERILIQSNVNNGDFDYEALANYFDLEDLEEWGVPISFDLSGYEPEEEEKDEEKPKKQKECPNCGEIL